MVYENGPFEAQKLEAWKDAVKDVILFEDYSDEDTWKKARRKGLGGSDIGVCMGLNPYMSKYQLYLAKACGKEVNLDGNDKVNKGKILEPYIFTEFVKPYFENTDYVPVICKDSMSLKSDPLYRFNVDGLYFTKSDEKIHPKGIIEIKLVFEYSEDKWYGSTYQGIPASYYAQVQWYMHCSNVSQTTVCAFFDRTWKANFFTVVYDEDFVKEMLSNTRDFWNCVETMAPPKLDAELDKEYILDEFSKNKIISYIESQDLIGDLLTYKSLSDEIKEKEKALNVHKSVLVNSYLKGIIPPKGFGTISMTKITRADLDSAKVQTLLTPEQFAACMTSSEYMRTTIKVK